MASNGPSRMRQLRSRWAQASLGGMLIACTLSTSAQAQVGAEPPGLLNKLGRYLGIGYSYRGYHTPSRAMPNQPFEYRYPAHSVDVHPGQLTHRTQSVPSFCPECAQSVGGRPYSHPSDAVDFDRPSRSREDNSSKTENALSEESTERPTESLLDEPGNDPGDSPHSDLLIDDSLLQDDADATHDDDLLLFNGDFSDGRTNPAAIMAGSRKGSSDSHWGRLSASETWHLRAESPPLVFHLRRPQLTAPTPRTIR